MINYRNILLGASSLMASSLLASAGGEFIIANSPETSSLSNDQGQYHLFNPTPREAMRELSPDRPDVTESALTVDAGHYAFEISVFDFRRNNGDEAYTYMATNFKIGLTNNTDIQFVFDSYSREDLDAGGAAEGFSDMQVRLKYNVWGNDSGDSALALFPYVKIPTNTELSNGEWEGGLIIPFSTQLSDRVRLGLMAELDVVYDDATQGHDLEFLHTAVLGFDLTDRIGNYLEYIGVVSEGDYRASLAGGVTYAVNDDLVLDVGAQFGLNDAAEDFGAFSGFTVRF